MRGWLLVLTLVNLILANAIVWFAIAQGWPQAERQATAVPALAAAGAGAYYHRWRRARLR